MILAMVGGKKRKRKSEEPTSDYQMYSKNVEYTLESTGAVAIREVVITPLTAAARAPATRVAPPPTAKEIEAYAVRIAHAAG